MRIDLYLTENGMAESRNKAQQMISSGIVFANGRRVSKPSFEVEGAKIEIIGAAMPYVGRGGLKLEKALDHFGVDPRGLICADIGASTGGFTDCLLKRGAKRVYAVDCGSGQLHEKLKNDGRVVNIENFNARDLTPGDLSGNKVDLAVMDVSFISQTLLYPAVCRILKDHGVFLSLIKPQFEVGQGGLGKNGIVKDKALYRSVTDSLKIKADEYGLSLEGLTESPVKGGDGNTEFLAYFKYERSTIK